MGRSAILIQFTRFPKSLRIVKFAVSPLTRTSQPPKRRDGSFAKTSSRSFSSQSRICRPVASPYLASLLTGIMLHISSSVIGLGLLPSPYSGGQKRKPLLSAISGVSFHLIAYVIIL